MDEILEKIFLIRSFTTLNMKNIKNTFFYSILVFLGSHQHACYAAEMTAKPELTFSPIKEALGSVATPLAYVSLTVELYYVTKGTKSLLFPTEIEQARAMEVGRETKVLDAKKEFKSCLMKNRTSSERGPSGRPSSCEQAAYMLAMLGEREEVKKMTIAFNHYRK